MGNVLKWTLASTESVSATGSITSLYPGLRLGVACPQFKRITSRYETWSLSFLDISCYSKKPTVVADLYALDGLLEPLDQRVSAEVV